LEKVERGVPPRSTFFVLTFRNLARSDRPTPFRCANFFIRHSGRVSDRAHLLGRRDPAGGFELTVGRNFAFRRTANTMTIGTLNVNAAIGGASLTASNLTP
jgi:hypothetical protein